MYSATENPESGGSPGPMMRFRASNVGSGRDGCGDTGCAMSKKVPWANERPLCAQRSGRFFGKLKLVRLFMSDTWRVKHKTALGERQSIYLHFIRKTMESFNDTVTALRYGVCRGACLLTCTGDGYTGS